MVTTPYMFVVFTVNAVAEFLCRYMKLNALEQILLALLEGEGAVRQLAEDMKQHMLAEEVKADHRNRRRGVTW